MMNTMKPIKLKLVLVIVLMNVAFSQFSFAAPGQVDVPGLEDLVNRVPGVVESESSINPIRLMALRDAAFTYGIQAGLASEYAKTMKRLESTSINMDRTYPFQALMMEGGVVPPIIAEVNNVFDQTGVDKIRISDRERTIISAPRFSYTTPSWRDYYYHDFRFDQNTTPMVTPKTPDELEFWKKSVREGYAAGIEQAHKVFENDTALLSRDINGMRLYHQLLLAGKVTKPYVATIHSGVTGDKNSLLKEGESFLKISATPEFIMDSNLWTVPLPSTIRDRIKIMVDPVAGGALVDKLGIAKESDSFSANKKESKK